MMDNSIIKCAVCGEEKIIMDKKEYQWKIGEKYYCSYNCFRKHEKPIIEKDRKRKKNNILWHK